MKSVDKLTDSNEMNHPGLKELYNKTYRMCLFYLRNREEAQDVAQDVFLKISENLKKYRGEAAFSTWVWKICSNTLSNYYRRKKIVSFLSLDIIFEKGNKGGIYSSFDSDPAAVLAGSEEDSLKQQAYEKALLKLSEREKRAFYLFYYEDLPVREVAAVMDATEAAVESLLVKARKKIRKEVSAI